MDITENVAYIWSITITVEQWNLTRTQASLQFNHDLDHDAEDGPLEVAEDGPLFGFNVGVPVVDIPGQYNQPTDSQIDR